MSWKARSPCAILLCWDASSRLLRYAAPKAGARISAWIIPDTDEAHWRVVTRLESGVNNAIEFHTDPVKVPAKAGEPVPQDE